MTVWVLSDASLHEEDVINVYSTLELGKAAIPVESRRGAEWDNFDSGWWIRIPNNTTWTTDFVLRPYELDSTSNIRLVV